MVTDAMDDEQRHAVFLYLCGDAGPPRDEHALVRRSSFAALLMDARGTAGRDIHTGELRDRAHSSSWLAALGYLCWFDQVGQAVHLVDHKGKSDGFHACLKQFSDLSSADRNALYGLRNAFSHNYGLVCHDPKGKHHHAFHLDVDAVELVVHEESPWDGNYPAGPGCTTTIGMVRLGDLVESVRNTVLKADGEGQITTSLSAAELSDRYLFEYVR